MGMDLVPALEATTYSRPAVVDVEVNAPQRSLRRLLVGSDAAAALAGWTLGILVAAPVGARPFPTILLISLAAGCSLALMASRRLYRARVSSVRAVELQLLLQVSLLTAGCLFVLRGTIPGLEMSGAQALLGGATSFAALGFSRGVYRRWVAAQRRSGRFGRSVILVGTNENAREVVDLLQDHPESGLSIVGVVGGNPQLLQFQAPWLGGCDRAVAAAREVGATGALVVSSAVPPDELNSLCRQLLDAGIHVQLSSGLRRIAHHRLRVVPIAHESLIYLERATLSWWQLALKRGIDVVGASALLLAAAPVLAVAALTIKLMDGGPVLFHQVRVGRGGTPFTCYKLRTMVPDAERRLAEVAARNERSGPLFKLSRDPRVTPVGRFLRISSIDELPQLYNVIRGTMSLVGPRPALPHEVDHFDEELRSRVDVAPGITGLWQLEARDNPAFGAYRRLDLFYVENWSVALDISILFGTGGVAAARLLRALMPVQRRGAGATVVLE